MFKALVEKWNRRKRVKALKQFHNQLKHILHLNDDILVASAKDKVREIIAESETVNPGNAEETEKFLDRAPLRVVKILPRKTFPTLREYADILAVAFTVAFGARALYVQPFKIPTSSMQPTLFGIHYIADKDTLPHLPGPLSYALFSAEKADLTVKQSGELDERSLYTYNKYILYPQTKFNIGGVEYELPGEINHVQKYCLKGQKEFNKGDVLCDGWLSLGDHLFVDRYTYHFRDPARGEIVVFNTEGLPCSASGFFYIKRLIGMPGDTLKIINGAVHVKAKGSDNFVPITDFNIKGIEKIYSYKGGYHGHLPLGSLVNEQEVYVPENSYFMMGDNTSNSSDSRFWGFVPRKNIVGKALLVFWPISRRWGIADHEGPLPVPTNPMHVSEAMELQ
ncbi:MAG: signal peptidase I [Lentisphaerae bacterium]|nr:signal peptidase I [Lentisphaerota bacterium]